MSFFKQLFGKPMQTSEAFRQLTDQSMEELRLKTSAHDASWRLGEADWAVDQDDGTIIFTRPDGIRAVCPVQIIGTYNTNDGTWLWGWQHPSVVEPLQAHAWTLHEYGKANNIATLTTPKITCSEDEAWEFAALACKLNNAQGAYRGPAGATLVFMTFGTVKLQAAETAETADQQTVAPNLTPIEAPDVIAFVQSYHAELFAIDQSYNQLEQTDQASKRAAFPQAIKAKQVAYQRYWQREDDYHLPISISSRSEYDPQTIDNWQVYQFNDDTYHVTYDQRKGPLTLNYAYQIKRLPEGLRIVDFLF
jgi:hypothetical protein